MLLGCGSLVLPQQVGPPPCPPPAASPGRRALTAAQEPLALETALPTGIPSPYHCGSRAAVFRMRVQGQNLVNRSPLTRTGFEEMPVTRVSLELLFVPRQG